MIKLYTYSRIIGILVSFQFKHILIPWCPFFIFFICVIVSHILINQLLKRTCPVSELISESLLFSNDWLTVRHYNNTYKLWVCSYDVNNDQLPRKITITYTISRTIFFWNHITAIDPCPFDRWVTGKVCLLSILFVMWVTFSFQRTWWSLFQKHVVGIKFDIYVFIWYVSILGCNCW